MKLVFLMRKPLSHGFFSLSRGNLFSFVYELRFNDALLLAINYKRKALFLCRNKDLKSPRSIFTQTLFFGRRDFIVRKNGRALIRLVSILQERGASIKRKIVRAPKSDRSLNGAIDQRSLASVRFNFSALAASNFSEC
jgi:hypothetical protein